MKKTSREVGRVFLCGCHGEMGRSRWTESPPTDQDKGNRDTCPYLGQKCPYFAFSPCWGIVDHTMRETSKTAPNRGKSGGRPKSWKTSCKRVGGKVRQRYGKDMQQDCNKGIENNPNNRTVEFGARLRRGYGRMTARLPQGHGIFLPRDNRR